MGALTRSVCAPNQPPPQQQQRPVEQKTSTIRNNVNLTKQSLKLVPIKEARARLACSPPPRASGGRLASQALVS